MTLFLMQPASMSARPSNPLTGSVAVMPDSGRAEARSVVSPSTTVKPLWLGTNEVKLTALPLGRVQASAVLPELAGPTNPADWTAAGPGKRPIAY